MPFRAHLHTVNRHRRMVRHYCFRLGLVWQGLTHDLSKYSPTEFWRGVKYYQGWRIAACRVYQGDQYTDASPYEYYQRSKDMRRTDASRFMHPDTAALLDRWLLLLKEQGEDAALASIRRELGDDAY